MKWLFRPVDCLNLTIFRVLFGSILLWEVFRYWARIPSLYTNPKFHFTYDFFHWVKVWPDDGMYIHFTVLGIAALGIIFGFCYRLCGVVYFIGFLLLFCMEQAKYLNHWYAVILMTFLMTIVNAHQGYSLDALWNKKRRPTFVPYWNLALLHAQIGIVYFYGGIAKINIDWLQGEPLRHWLSKPHRLAKPVLGQFLDDAWAPYFFSYSGLVFDLSIPFLLLWKRTRAIAFLAVLLFNLTNDYIFSIGIFPWVMMGALLLFLEPGTLRKVLRKLPLSSRFLLLWKCIRFIAFWGLLFLILLNLYIPNSVVFLWIILGALLLFLELDIGRDLIRKLLPGERPQHQEAYTQARYQTCVKLFLILYLSFQFLLPLRHHLFPGNVAWTEEGHKFSWRMKLRDKAAYLRIHMVDKDKKRMSIVNPILAQHLTQYQYRKMITRPDLFFQYIQFLKQDAAKRGFSNISIYAKWLASLNGRSFQWMVDPRRDLATITYSPFRSSDWILPLPDDLPPGEHYRESPTTPPSLPLKSKGS